MAWRLASSVDGVGGRAYVHVYDARSRTSSNLHPRKSERARPVHSHHDSTDPGAGDSRRGETDRRPCAGTAQPPAAAEAHSRGPTESRRQRRRSQTNKSHQSNHGAVSQLELGKFARGAGPSDASAHQHQHSRTGRSTTATTGATTGPGRHGKGRDRGGSRLPDGDVAARRINQAILDASAGRQYESILQLVADHGAAMGGVNTATALHQLGSCGLEPGGKEARRLLADPRFRQLGRIITEKHISAFAGQQAANGLWALAKLGYRRQVAPAADRRACTDGGDEADRRTCTYGGDEADRFTCTDGGVAGDRSGGSSGSSSSYRTLLAALCTRLEAKFERLNPQDTAMSLWALGRLGHFPGEALLRALTDRLLAVLSKAKPQEVSNSLLGLAKLGWSPGPGVLDQLAHGSLDKVPNFKPQGLSNTLWSLARLEHRHDQLQAAIFRQASERISEFNSQDISNLIWAAATLGLGPPCRETQRGMTHEGTNGASHQTHGGVIPEQLLRLCCDRARETLQDFSSQELSNLLWATAKLGYHHEPLLRASAACVAGQLSAEPAAVAGQDAGSRGSSSNRSSRGGVSGSSWSHQSIANITWAYATLGFDPGPEYVNQVCVLMSSRSFLRGCNWQNLANMVWALATLHHHSRDALAAVEQEVVSRLQGPGPATAGGVGVTTHGERPARLAQRYPQLRTQHLSNLLWDFATLQQPAPELFSAALPLLVQHVTECNAQDLSNSAWAAARLQVYDERFMDGVAEHIVTYRLLDLNPQDVASLAWAYGALRHAHRPLFDGLVGRAVTYMSHSTSGRVGGTALKMAELASIYAAVGIFGWQYPDLFRATARRLKAVGRRDGLLEQQRGAADSQSEHLTAGVPAKGSEEKPAEAAQRAVAAAMVPPPQGSMPQVPCQLHRAADYGATLMQLKPRDVCTLAWGLSLAGGCTPRMWARLLEVLSRAMEAAGGGVEALLDEELAQLYQAYLHIQLDFPSAALALGPPGLLSEAALAWRRQCAQGSRVSTFQREVGQALSRLGLRHTVELLVDDGKFSIDLALELRLEVSAAPTVTSAADHLPLGAQRPRQQPGEEARPSAALSRTPQNAMTAAPAAGGKGERGHFAARDGGRPASKDHKLVRVAVEADGPWHFTANTLQPLGTTLYRSRCLEARGWVVVSVPYWRWQQAAGGSGSSGGRDALLAELLREAGLGEALAVQPAAGASKEKKQKKRSVRSRVVGGHS